jgi:alanyl-tRNA synthetase
MQTEKCYYDYTTDKPFTAQIVTVKPWEDGNEKKTAIVLNKTIFYPGDGGQPGDRGTINSYALVDIQEQAGELLHIVSGEQNGQLIPGPAELILDAERRRDFTVQHSAQHLLSGTLFRLTGYNTVSMHLGNEINTIDIAGSQLPPDTLFAAEEAAAKIIADDVPFTVHLCPPEDIGSFSLRKIPPRGEEVIRVIEIQGADFTPCCGTHCKSSGQIGILCILDAEKYKGMTRIHFIAGKRVLESHRLLHKNACLISRSLNVPLGETDKGTLALLEKANALEWRVKEMEEAAAKIKARTFIEKFGPLAQDKNAVLAESYNTETIDEVIRIGKAAQKLSKSVLILASEKDLQFVAFCSDKNRDIRTLVSAAFEKAKGKGGGGPSFFHGLFAEKKDLSAFLAEVKS